ncbi:hypothetical protein CHS0354_002115, partial [Potamilus streckersoni]
MANQLKATFTRFRFAKRATQRDMQAKKILQQIYGNTDLTKTSNQLENPKTKNDNAILKRKATHPAYTYTKEKIQIQNNNNGNSNHHNIANSMAETETYLYNKRPRTNQTELINCDIEIATHNPIDISNEQVNLPKYVLIRDTPISTSTSGENRGNKIRFANDQEKPGPSNTHTIEELREIMAALAQDTADTAKESINKENNEQQIAKRPRTDLKTQRYNSSKNDKTTKGENRPQPKHKLQPHPRHLTLYLTTP